VQFAGVATGGVAVGIVLALAFIAIHLRLRDPFIEVLLSLTVPYIAYIAAESVHASGVLAVVAAGLVRGRYAPEIVSAEMRIIARPVWNLVVFLLNSLIFMLIGIQMSAVVEGLARYSAAELLGLGLAVSAVAIAVRFAWVYPVAWLPRRLAGSLRENEPKPRKRELAIIGWCGMRGIVSLAAALALPATLPDGSPFPHRDLVVFLTFFVIAATLIGQGLSLPALIRRLKVGSDWSMRAEQQRVRAAMSGAALAAIDEIIGREGAPAEWAERLRQEIAERIALAAPDGLEVTPRSELVARLRHAALLAERRELIRLWRDNEISDEVMHHLEEILDYQEAHL
jgi:CPA1 family monovalent cation:H+ antiporter